ncbi:conserved hypothetical protein [Trichinella spiralis]|uniref:hypothetical protein n=1 Tax=Trichinella spiralis TaxID=6334 RepID=UPI0001EFD9EC|nr:conserved hypothetical protein [Trichinella spiralis]
MEFCFSETVQSVKSIAAPSGHTPPDDLITTQTRGWPAKPRRAPGSDGGGLRRRFRRLTPIRVVVWAKVDDHLFFFNSSLLRDVACCALGRRSMPKIFDMSRHPVHLYRLLRDNAYHSDLVVSDVIPRSG